MAPGLPEVAEHALMKSKMNSYGKTWHVWETGGRGTQGDRLPLGPPRLAWSFNADGEVRPEMVRARDQAMDISTEENREDRQDLVDLAHPQRGVDALSAAFPERRKPPGIVAAAASE